MKIIKLIFATLALMPAYLGGQTAQEFFMMGNNAYKAQDYARAKENYLESQKGGMADSDLLFNLANTHAKLGEKSQAQLAYMKALYRNPRMREAEANLAILAKDASLELPSKDGAASFCYELSEYEWTIIAFVSFWLMAIFVFVPPLYFKKSAVWTFLALACTIVMLTAIAGIYNWRTYASTAIAMSDDTPLLVSPASNAPITARMAEGQIAAVKKRFGDFMYVEAPSGKCGWAKRGKMLTVED